MKRQVTDWEKVFQIMYLIKDLYPEHTNFSKLKMKNKIKNGQNIWTYTSPKKIYWSQINTVKQYTSIFTDAMQNKNTVRYHCTSTTNVWY